MMDPKEKSQIRLLFIGAGISLVGFVTPIAIWFYFYTKNSIEYLKEEVQELKGQIAVYEDTKILLLRLEDSVNALKEEAEKTNQRFDKQQESFEKFKDGYYHRIPAYGTGK